MFPEYLQNPTLHNRDVDLAASALADAARRTVLLQHVEPASNIVTILTGSPASGKTINATGEQPVGVEMVHETIFTSLQRARQIVLETGNAGRIPSVHLFYTDDPRINLHRMLDRALKIGRTVPIRYMAETYIGVPKIVYQLQQEFSESLTVRVTNNSETRELAVAHNSLVRALYHTQRYTEDTCREAMHVEIERPEIRDHLPAEIFAEATL